MYISKIQSHGARCRGFAVVCLRARINLTLVIKQRRADNDILCRNGRLEGYGGITDRSIIVNLVNGHIEGTSDLNLVESCLGSGLRACPQEIKKLGKVPARNLLCKLATHTEIAILARRSRPRRNRVDNTSRIVGIHHQRTAD